jgi:hypothetical protein
MATYYGTCYNSKGQAMIPENGLNGYSFYVEVEYTQSIENNTSTLTIKPYVVDAHGGSFTWYFKLDGADYYSVFQNTYSSGNTVSGSTATKTVTHNADGTKTFTLNVSLETSYVAGANNNLNTYCIQRASLSQSITLNTIPRTSDFSFDDFTMGSAGTISINRASSSFTHVVTYKFGSASGTISSNATTSASWTPSRDLGHQIPNSLSGTGTITVATYSGSTHVGSKSKTFTLWVTGDMYPTFSSIGVAGINLFEGNYVQSKSKVELAINGATGSYGSTITNYSIVGSNLTVSSSYGVSGYLSVSGNQTYTATITDSRGRTCTKTTSIYVHPYTSPTVSFTSVTRADSNYNPKDNGIYANVNIKFVISDIAYLGSNAKNYILYYKPVTSSSWEQVSGTLSSYYGDGYYIPLYGIVFDLTKTYDIQIRVSDSYGDAVATAKLQAGRCLLDIESSGLGVGKFWEQGALDINGNVYIDGKKLYEVGWFNPAFYVSDGSSAVYTRRNAVYQKFGEFCTCNISLRAENFSNGSTPTNEFKIIDLPFFNKGVHCAVTIGFQAGLYLDANNDFGVKAYIRPNDNSIVFVRTQEAKGDCRPITGEVIGGALLDFTVSFTYKVE